jgi:hypothetical protein
MVREADDRGQLRQGGENRGGRTRSPGYRVPSGSRRWGHDLISKRDLHNDAAPDGSISSTMESYRAC